MRMPTVLLLALISSNALFAQQTSQHRQFVQSEDTLAIQSMRVKFADHETYSFLVTLTEDSQHVRFYVPFIGVAQASISYSMTPDTSEGDSSYIHLSYGVASDVGVSAVYVAELQDSTRYWYGSERTVAINVNNRSFPAPYLVVDAAMGSKGDGIQVWVYIYIYLRREL